MVRFSTLLALALIPLQWFILLPSPIGDLRAHQLAVFGITFLIAAKYGIPRIVRATRHLQFFIVVNVYMLLLSGIMYVYNGGVPIQPIQEFLYLVSFTAVSTLFFIAATEPSHRLIDALRWAGLTTVSILLFAFAASLAKNGINPIGVFQQTIVSADPSVLTKELFGHAFVGFGLDAETTQTQIRHEVFGGLLLSMYIASWANSRRPLTDSGHILIYRSAMVVGGLLVLLSLSRAVTLAALLWPLILLIRAIMDGRVSGGQLAGVVVTVIGLAGLAATGFLVVIWDRFTQDTTGYTARADNLSLAVQRIKDNFWTGGVDTSGTSSHNFIFDNWQRGGFFVAVPAIIVFLYIFGLWITQLLRIRTLPTELLPLAAALALPVFRLLTQGGGQIAVNGWMTMAFVTGVLQAQRYGKQVEAEQSTTIAARDEAVIRRHRLAGLPALARS